MFNNIVFWILLPTSIISLAITYHFLEVSHLKDRVESYEVAQKLIVKQYDKEVVKVNDLDSILEIVVTDYINVIDNNRSSNEINTSIGYHNTSF
jgi:hypothetical protein